MGLGSFIMVHNAWGGVVGNRNDLAEAIETLGKIDGAQMDIFEARTGLPRATIEKYMNAETFFTAKDAVANGFADEVFDAPKGDAQARVAPEINAKRRLEVLLAQTGVPRVERRKMINEATGGMQDATPAVTQDADLDPAAVAQFLSTLRS